MTTSTPNNILANTDVILLNDLELTLSLSEIYENIDIEEVA
jgi:hypothetical protein